MFKSELHRWVTIYIIDAFFTSAFVFLYILNPHWFPALFFLAYCAVTGYAANQVSKYLKHENAASP